MTTGESCEVRGDLDADEEHAHEVGDDHSGDPEGREGDADAAGAVAVESKVHQDQADAAEHKHESGGEALDDVLAVDAAGEEDDGADGAGEVVLGAADAGGLDDDVVDKPGDHGEVGEEDEGEDSHRGGEGQGGGKLQAGARRAEEAVREDPEEVEEGIHRTLVRGLGGTRAGSGGLLRFGRHGGCSRTPFSASALRVSYPDWGSRVGDSTSLHGSDRHPVQCR